MSKLTKTSVELPDELLTQFKMTILMRKIKMKEAFEEAIISWCEANGSPPPETRISVPSETSTDEMLK